MTLQFSSETKLFEGRKIAERTSCQKRDRSYIVRQQTRDYKFPDAVKNTEHFKEGA